MMAILLNKSSEIEDAREMPNSEIEKYIQLAYKRESNRQILRERLIEGKTYREIIERHYFSPVGDWMEEKAGRVIHAWTNEIQRMETKFYRVVRRNRRADNRVPAADVVPVRHGRWVMNDQSTPVCSRCGNVVAFVSHPDKKWDFGNYCPNCGAKMDGEA